MKYKIEYNIGDYVYLTTDNDQCEFIVTAITLRQYGPVYELTCGIHSSWHQSCEINVNRDIVKATTN